MIFTVNDFFISTDKNLLDVNCIYNYLTKESYWAKNISATVVEKSIACSVCFGVYRKEQTAIQVGFARVITDHATFGYLADVFILKAYRGIGLSKLLMQTIMENPGLQGFRRWLLATKDAHGLYEKFGFTLLENTGRLMGYKPFDEYAPLN
jgi:GNAT superfamily N-acetyltransferase